MNTKMLRHDGRACDQLRKINVLYNVFGYASGNVLFELGNTKVLCSVMLQRGVPPFLKGKKTGWLTAEYSMLPTSTSTRSVRESVTLKRNGRSVEISRLLGRSLRSIVDLSVFGEQTITVDCDVLQADGGTRTAAITGAYLALKAAESQWIEQGIVPVNGFVKQAIGAISVGVVDGQPLLDLDCEEDNCAEADFNFVLTQQSDVIEVQGTAEKFPLSWDAYQQVQKLARTGIAQLITFCDQNVKKTVSPKKDTSQKAPLFSLERRVSMQK